MAVYQVATLECRLINVVVVVVIIIIIIITIISIILSSSVISRKPHDTESKQQVYSDYYFVLPKMCKEPKG